MIKGIVVMSKLNLDNMNFRKISKNGTSKTVTIPQNWANIGERVCVVVKDENTLMVTKKL